MAKSITKEDALAIAKKLDAKLVEGARHTLAKVYHEGKKVAQFVIQRGSKKDAPHPHLPAQLFVNRADCLRLAECTLSQMGWLEILKSKGELDAETGI